MSRGRQTETDRFDRVDHRPSLWDGRQMFPDQMIHKSVKIRLMHDWFPPPIDESRYVKPAARLPIGWGEWEDVAQGDSKVSAQYWEE